MSEHNIRSILYVEDQEADQKLLAMLLPSDEYRVSIVKNGEEAIEKLRNEEFDLVVMDIEMPQMNGFEASREIREKLKLSSDELPILALSINDTQANKIAAMESGINEFMAKPYDQTQLIMAMEMLLHPEGFDSFQEAKELTSSPQPTSPIVNIEQVESFITFIGLGRTKELLEEFGDDYDMRADKLFDAKTSKDEIGRELHAIASMSGNIGLQRFSIACRELMNDIKTVTDDGLFNTLSELHNLYEISIQELRRTLRAIEHDS